LQARSSAWPKAAGRSKIRASTTPRVVTACQQSADRLAPHHAGLDHRTTLPPSLSPPWQTSGAEQCPIVAPPVAQSFPPLCGRQ
jgi:hypothetical protein